ncbi:MAG: hypothetical protein RIF41_15145 [Polyangiaceae bacterium]
MTVCTFAAGARAECDVGKDDVGLAFVWGERDCRHNVHADLRYGLYKSSASPTWRTQVAGELGLLERVADTRWQVGPVLALGGAGQTHDWEGSFDEFYLSPRVRARMWMLDEWMTFEGALGPSIHWNQGPRGDWITRTGGYVELGPTFHGVVGLYVGTGYTPAAGDALAPMPGEWRHTFGIRMNLTFSAALAAMAGILYACGKSPCL